MASKYYPDSKLLSGYPDNTDIRFSPNTHTKVTERSFFGGVNITQSLRTRSIFLVINMIVYKLHEISYLIQNSQAVKKVCGPQKGYGEKRCEIQGGGQEMAVMVG